MTRCLFLLFSILVACRPEPARQPALSPEHQKAIDGFQLMEGFRMELVAAEPLIADPVAMEVDEQGRLYVVEMPGYPLDLGKSGKIKLLKDTDNDGYPDKSVVFADSLTLPTGIMRWRNGLIVTDAPDVWYLEDTNGDDRADVRRKMLTGFALSNPQHNLNSPLFGLDNWIYLAHEGPVTPFVYKKEFGDEGAPVHFPDNPKTPLLARNANGRNVRFRPDTHEIEELSGETQFGQTFDPWGHHLLTSNANHLFHEVLAARYLRQNPNLLVPDATQSIPDHGDAAEVYPITENPNHQLLTDRGVITSSCGVTWYGGGAFGEKFDNVTFIAEPTHNLVHADVIEEKGASFVAKRLLEKREFLASKDAWFRPVNFYIGPEGALYVIDYYRQSIEHPEWMSEEMTKSGTLYNGKDKGRIYRIVPENGLPMDWLNRLALDKLSVTEQVSLLENRNVWYRRTAQRLLFERKPREAPALLWTLLAETNVPEAKVHALWLLDGLNALDVPTLHPCLNDASAGVRENAVRVAERLLTKSGNRLLERAVLALQNDPSAKVRFQVLCTLGSLNDPEAQKARLAILKKDFGDKWVGIAAIASAAGQEMTLFEQMASEKNLPESGQQFFAYLGATIANRGKVEEVRKLLEALGRRWMPSLGGMASISALDGIARLWQHKGVTVSLTDADRLTLLPDFSSAVPVDVQKARMDLLRLTGLPKNKTVDERVRLAASIAVDSTQPVNRRTTAVQLLALYNPNAYNQLLQQLSLQNGEETLRLAALKSLGQTSGRRACQFALAQWPKLTPKMKQSAIEVFMDHPDQIPTLLAAIDRRQIQRHELAWPQQVHLMNFYDKGIRTMARRVLAVAEDRKAVLQQYQPALAMRGDMEKGRILFRQVCSSCHQMDGRDGQTFGPDLASVRNRNPHNLLTEILHPNNSIADGYDLVTITLITGNQLLGIIAQETPAALTLRTSGGTQVTLSRNEVKKMTKSRTSAMPNGLENSLTVQQMGDLLTYIKNR